MKKILAFALSILIVGTAFVGCEDTDNESEINDTSSISEVLETATKITVPVTEEETTEPEIEKSTEKNTEKDFNHMTIDEFAEKYVQVVQKVFDDESIELEFKKDLTSIDSKIGKSYYLVGDTIGILDDAAQENFCPHCVSFCIWEEDRYIKSIDILIITENAKRDEENGVYSTEYTGELKKLLYDVLLSPYLLFNEDKSLNNLSKFKETFTNYVDKFGDKYLIASDDFADYKYMKSAYNEWLDIKITLKEKSQTTK